MFLGEVSVIDRLKALWLLLEIIGMHPRIPTVSEEYLEMLRRAGWREFRCEWVKR